MQTVKTEKSLLAGMPKSYFSFYKNTKYPTSQFEPNSETLRD